MNLHRRWVWILATVVTLAGACTSDGDSSDASGSPTAVADPAANEDGSASDTDDADDGDDGDGEAGDDPTGATRLQRTVTEPGEMPDTIVAATDDGALVEVSAEDGTVLGTLDPARRGVTYTSVDVVVSPGQSRATAVRRLRSEALPACGWETVDLVYRPDRADVFTEPGAVAFAWGGNGYAVANFEGFALGEDPTECSDRLGRLVLFTDDGHAYFPLVTLGDQVWENQVCDVVWSDDGRWVVVETCWEEPILFGFDAEAGDAPESSWSFAGETPAFRASSGTLVAGHTCCYPEFTDADRLVEIDPASGDVIRELLPEAVDDLDADASGDHLVFVRDGTLYRWSFEGDPVALGDGYVAAGW